MFFMSRYCITMLTPGRDEHFFNGALGAKSPKLSKTQCTVFSNIVDANFTMQQIIEKHPQFIGDIQILELTPVVATD